MSALLGGTEVHDMASAIVGDTFRVFVGHCGPDPQAVLVVSDANGLFGLTLDTVRLMQIPALVPSLLVVGVGYPHAERVIDTIEIRTRDLTPTSSELFPASGQADDFLAFLGTELQPWIADRYPRAAEHLTYFGHSLGGLFGVYAMLTRTAPFDRYILSSPSLWWDDEMIFAFENEHGGDVTADVFFGIGTLETDAGRRLEATNLADAHPAKPPSAHLDMVDDLRRFIAQLTSRDDPSRNVATIEVDDEFHATVPGVVLTRGLRHFYASDAGPRSG